MATEQETGKAGGTAPRPDSPEKKMGRKKLLSASNASAYVLLTVGAVVLINLISTRVFGRLDLTESHVYTLAPGSKAIVGSLPDYLTVKAYISKELPPELQSVSRYTRDLLDEYRTYSKGKLRFEVYDPTGDKKVEDEAGQCKVQKLQSQLRASQAAQAHVGVERGGLRAAVDRRHRARQLDRDARLRPPRPDAEQGVHAGAGVEGRRQGPA